MDMPVSLAVGTIRTPEFAVKREAYLVMIRAEKRLPFADMNCMLGLSTPLPDPNCNKEPLAPSPKDRNFKRQLRYEALLA